MGISYFLWYDLTKAWYYQGGDKVPDQTIRIDLELPKELFIKGRESVQRAKLEALKRLAATFYADGSLSLGKAAELAKVSKQEFVDFIATCNIPLNYNVNELEDDLATIAAMQPNDQGGIASDPKTQTKPKGVVRAVAGIWKDRPDLVEEMLRMREDEDDRLGTTIEYAIERPSVTFLLSHF